MLDGIDNLIDMSLRLVEYTPILLTKQETPGIERRTKSRREHQLNDGPRYYMIVRRKPQRVYVFRILHAVKLKFPF